jgi:hypothetical protein
MTSRPCELFNSPRPKAQLPRARICHHQKSRQWTALARARSTRIVAGSLGNRIDGRFASTSRWADKIQLGARH